MALRSPSSSLSAQPLSSASMKAFSRSRSTCVGLAPLIKQLPIVGGVQLFFLGPPEIDFDLLGIGNVAHNAKAEGGIGTNLLFVCERLLEDYAS